MLDNRSPSDLSLVEIAQRLEGITGEIEAQRVREREARAAYKSVAEDVERKVAEIRASAKALLDEQRRRMASFDGMFDRSGRPALGDERAGGDESGGRGGAVEVKLSRKGKLSLPEAILKIWREGDNNEPLTTDEIATALTEIGYTTRASARSLKSTMNQALAKLCREGQLRRYRIDGTEISSRDTKSRARRYMATS